VLQFSSTATTICNSRKNLFIVVGFSIPVICLFCQMFVGKSVYVCVMIKCLCACFARVISQTFFLINQEKSRILVEEENEHKTIIFEQSKKKNINHLFAKNQ
jgi:hypothetical protein